MQTAGVAVKMLGMIADPNTLLFDRLPIGAYRSTPAGRQLRANAALVRLHGYTSEGLWQEAAWPALLLIAVGLLPVRWLVRSQG